jgi:DNA-binding transcriptional ArsR family regulator
MARPTLDLVDPRIAKALSHPMRARILMILNERVASPNEIADTIGERLPNVSYHVRALLELGTIELVDTAQRRGAIEHYYRAIVRPFFSDKDWKRLPRSGRQAISDSILQILWDDVSESIKAGAFEARADRHLTHSRMALDDEGWAEMTKLLNGVLGDVEKIEAASRNRLRKAGNGAGIPTTFALMHFESPPRPVHGQES